METKSLNCASCGAGLNSISLSHCVCSYCGNTNKILANGITMVDNPKKKSDPDNSFKNLTTSQKILVIGVIALTPLLITHFRKRKI